jgi:hypothetical protein
MSSRGELGFECLSVDVTLQRQDCILYTGSYPVCCPYSPCPAPAAGVGACPGRSRLSHSL